MRELTRQFHRLGTSGFGGPERRQGTERSYGKAELPLDTAVADTVKANSGYRTVSVVPMLDGGRPVAYIALMKGVEIKRVTENLD